MTVGTGEAHPETRDERPRGGVPADTFAARLMLARMHAGHLTIQDAAEKCGLINQSWSNWEKGMKPRDLVEVTQAISEGLGVDRDWLLFGGPLTKPAPPVRRRRRSQESDTCRYVRRRAESTARAASGPPAGRRGDNDRPRVLRRPGR